MCQVVDVGRYKVECQVAVDVKLEVPSPLSSVPRPLLVTAFKLLTRLVMVAVREHIYRTSQSP